MMLNSHFPRRQSGEAGLSQEDAQRWLGHPDVLCMHEYLHVYRARSAETPERRLMAAILRDAIECYVRHCCAENRHKKRSYREAEEWLFKGDDRDVFGLANVCAIFNLAPGYIRRMLLLYKRQNEASADSTPGDTPGELSINKIPRAS
jgi:hypothetical protein